ncbi:HNH endonuclease signature motif containing protein [Microbacterium gorillae]|uniref:HNH endonuclease signature motif containing protein n=1 Tax=Microbacterium gorillae TaxID=1231063 RepID=UPI0006942DE9|nr:HNH endonuclease signature motif containing protein [Microbacterium gorillae]
MTSEPAPPAADDPWVPAGGSFGRGSDRRLAALVRDAVRIDRQIARLQARRASVLDAVADVAECRAESASAQAREHELIIRDVSAELGTALRFSDRVIQAQVADATALVHRFPRTHAALEAGSISMSHARVILHTGFPIEDPALLDAFEAEAVPLAQHSSPGRLRSRIRMSAEASRNSPIDERHRAARARRCISVADGEDGMSDVHAHLPTALARALTDRIHAYALSIKRRRRNDPAHAGDDRTLAQISADVFCDLLLTTDPATAGDGLTSIRAHVQVTIPAAVLTGASASGAELAGHGPIDPDTARTLAAVAPGWDRLFQHPTSGHVLEIDRYQPSADQRRILRVRDERCRFPGCGHPATRSDADHTIDAALGGPTAISNLGHFCRRHHTLKHHTRWRADNLPGGIIRWTSPLGAVYTDHPPRTVTFTAPTGPAGDPPF